MKPKYSVAICPPVEIVDQVMFMKAELAERIGWFPSKNSHAHITFNVFEADDSEIGAVRKYLEQFCRSAVSSEVRFPTTGSYSNGAFYLSPDAGSHLYIKELMRRFHSGFPLKSGVEKSTDPHMSIARRLKKPDLEAANQLFGERNIGVGFLCDRLSVRMFDEDKKQYRIDCEFIFGNQEPVVSQTSLF